MSTLARIRRRLRSERGFTLIELLVATLLSGIVITAAISVMEGSVRASNEAVNRMDGLQKGRLALEEITQRLRAQVCPDNVTPAIVDATASSMSFFTELSAAAANGQPVFAPEGRRITFGSNKITEEVWNTLANPYANTFLAGHPPTTTRVVSDQIHPHGANPYFRYFTFVNDPATPSLELVPPISTADKALIVKIEVAFDSRPTGALQANNVDTSFQSDVFVRTADPTDPEHSPLCD